MSRYSNSEPYKNRGLGHYGGRGSDRYLASRPSTKHYNNPKPARTYSRPSGGRGGRGRSDRNSKPEYFQSPKPEKKYESVLNPEKMSGPQVERSPRYRLENGGMQTSVDEEQLVKEVEKRLGDRVTEQLLEKLEAELRELVGKPEKPTENSDTPLEPRIEPKQEGEKTDRIERDGGTPETQEESKDDFPLDGSFILSRPFGIAVPTEVDEAELEKTAHESENEKKDAVKESETESHENESVESESQDRVEESEEDSESKEEDKAETVDETEAEDIESKAEEIENPKNVETEEESGDGVAEEALEDIATEAEREETGEPISDEVIPEQLPEETELYPVEEEPMEIV